MQLTKNINLILTLAGCFAWSTTVGAPYFVISEPEIIYLDLYI